MSETMLQDAEIRRRYCQGQSTNAIARALGLRLSHVIGRVRALRLSPPDNGPQVAASEVGMAANPIPDPPASAPRDPGHLRPVGSKGGIERSELRCEYDQDDEPVQRKGCPRGWLVTEEQFGRSFHRSRGRFEDVARQRRPSAAAAPMTSGRN
ncbi:MAG TPA: hypothetical protein VK943_17815 [Arenibaculum sp.]|nr:hypothetical protein [Arenibaculum sp.]